MVTAATSGSAQSRAGMLKWADGGFRPPSSFLRLPAGGEVVAADNVCNAQQRLQAIGRTMGPSCMSDVTDCGQAALLKKRKLVVDEDTLPERLGKQAKTLIQRLPAYAQG